MKIGDIFVKLGLKKDEFSRGMQEAGGEMQAFGGKLKALPGIAKTVWAAVGAAVAKFAADAVKMTQRWGDAWNQTMDGIKGAYASFVRQISSGEGWDNLFANMREAYRVSKEVSAALDEIFERKVSFSYNEAETEKQIAALQLIARDSSKSEAERIAANKEIIRLTNDLGDAKKAIYQDEAAQQRRLFQLQSGLNDEQTDFLVKEYNQNRQVIQQAREYLKQKKDLSRVGGEGFFTESVSPIPSPVAKQQPISPELEKLERETPQAIKDIAELTKAYDRANDELVKNMADAEVAVIRIDTETMHAQTRATALLGTLKKAGGAGSGGPKTDPQEEAAQRIAQRAEDAAKSEIRLLTEKYNTERALLEQYGMDATALTEEYNRGMAEAMRKYADVAGATAEQRVEALHQGLEKEKAELAAAGADTVALMKAYSEAAAGEMQRYADMTGASASERAEALRQAYAKERAYLEQNGIETAELMERTFETLKQIEEQGLQELVDAILEEFPVTVTPVVFADVEDPDLNEIQVDPIEVMATVDFEFQSNIDALMSEMERAQELVDDFAGSVASGFSDAAQELANQLMGLEEFNAGKIVQALLTPLADMAVKAGEIIIAEGVAVEAAKAALSTFGGYGAIVAGGLLVAAGTAARAGLSALARSGSTTATTTAYSGGGGMGASQIQTIQTEMTVYVTGRLSGNDILLSGKKTQNNWNR